MARLFWMLLAAARGGYRYLRSVLRFAAGMVTRLTKAPGSDGGARLEQDTILDSGMVNRPVADGRIQARAGIADLAGHMVAWLVSVAYPKLLAGIAMLTTRMSTPPGSGMGKDARTEVGLTDAMDTAPGSPVAFPAERRDTMAAGAVTAPPDPMEAEQAADAALSALGVPGSSVLGTGYLADGRKLTAGAGSGSAASVRGQWPQDTGLTAHMMTWSGPEWVDGKTLYIRQVYSTERDGDTLILH